MLKAYKVMCEQRNEVAKALALLPKDAESIHLEIAIKHLKGFLDSRQAQIRLEYELLTEDEKDYVSCLGPDYKF